jgi:general secretion pathway protein I
MSVLRSHHGVRKGPSQHGTPGFTFLEILVALCIVLIALIPLIRLHVISIRMVDAGMRMSRATLLANDRLAEVLAREVPELGTSHGRVVDGDSHTTYYWTTTVTEVQPIASESTALAGIRRLRVDVTWGDGERTSDVSVETLRYVSPQKTDQVLETGNDGKTNPHAALVR